MDRHSTSPCPERSERVERVISVLLAEDNAADVLLVREALKLAGLTHELIVQRDGEQMFRYIERMDAGQAPCPDVILLDLNLPKKGGEALLVRIRESQVCGSVPVVIVTSSDLTKDRRTMAKLGASMYFHKSSDYDEFMKLGALVQSLTS